MRLTVKDIAYQLAAALPDDASLDDLSEFLYERSDVERGRQDCAAGRSLPNCEVLGADLTKSTQPVWSACAASALEATIEALAGRHDRLSILSGARDATEECLVADGITLPEMGDPAIREIHVRIGTIRYRLIFERLDNSTNVLDWTNNTTCYRNVRP